MWYKKRLVCCQLIVEHTKGDLGNLQKQVQAFDAVIVQLEEEGVQLQKNVINVQVCSL